MYVREKIGTVEKSLQMGKTTVTVYKLKLISARGIAIHINRYKWRRFVLSKPAAQREVPSLNCAGILEQSIRARNRVGIGLSYRYARAGIKKKNLWELAPSRNRVIVPARQVT